MNAPLSPLPASFAATVAALHRVAEEIVAPARKPDNEISLRATPGGFGTPEFEHGGLAQRVRVEGDELVRESGGEERRAPLTSLAAAAEPVADLLPAGAAADDEPLAVEREAALALGALYGFGATVLGRLVDAAAPGDEATIPRLWPEHFDIAIELGSEAAGVRANYGLSPGDEEPRRAVPLRRPLERRGLRRALAGRRVRRRRAALFRPARDRRPRGGGDELLRDQTRRAPAGPRLTTEEEK